MNDNDRITLSVSGQGFSTIMAALRYYQEKGMGNPDNRSDWIHDLSTNGGDVTSLDDEGIDKLCEGINN